MKTIAEQIKGITVQIGGDTTGLDKALKNVRKETGSLQSELKRVDQLLKLDPGNTVLLSQKMDILAESAEKVKKNHEALTEAKEELDRRIAAGEVEVATEQYRLLERSVIEADNRHQALTEQLGQTQKALEEARGAAEGLGTSTDDYAQKAQDAEKTTGDLNEKLDDSKSSGESGSKGVGAMTVALGDLVAKGIEKAISALGELYDKTAEYRDGLAKLNTSALEAGFGLENTQSALKTLNQVSGDGSANIEALSNLLNAGFDESNMQSVLDSLSGAVIRFPDTLKIESLADSLQETIATGQSTGQFAEMLGRAGIEVDKFDQGLAKAYKSGTAQRYVLQQLAHTDLAQTAQAYRDNNEELIANKDAQFELNRALVDISQQILPIVTEAVKTITQLLRDHGDEIATIIGTISEVVNILLVIISVLASVPAPVYAVIGGIVLAVTAFMKIFDAVDKVTGIFGIFSGKLSPVNAAVLQTTAIIMGVVVALVAFAAIIAVIMNKGSELRATMSDIGNSVGSIRSQVSGAQNSTNGFAKGTLSAPRGLAWVGEEGPELVDFRGGERVYTATQSRAMAASASGSLTQNQVSNYYVTIDAKNVREWNDVVRALGRRGMEIQKGVNSR